MIGPVEPLTVDDLPGCLALACDRAWPPEESKWRLLFDLAAVYGARDEAGDLAGAAVLTCYGGDLAAIGMMLVASRHGGRGLGRRIMTHVLAQAGDATVFLNATQAGRPLYEKLGFEAVGMIHTCAGDFAGPPVREARSRPAGPGDLAAIRRLDAQVNGVDRPRLVRFLPGFTEHLRVIERGGRITGYAGAWRSAGNVVIGPVIADGAGDAAALIADIAVAVDGPLRVDLDAGQARLAEWVTRRGLAVRAAEPLMVLGGRRLPGDRSRWFASLTQATG
jgi:GNAT superfamily N-acetyltransferase